MKQEERPVVNTTGNVGLMQAVNHLGFKLKKMKVDGQFCLTDGTPIGTTVDEAREFINELAGYEILQPIHGSLRSDLKNGSSSEPSKVVVQVPPVVSTQAVVKTIKASRQTVADEKLFGLRMIRAELGRIYVEMETINKHGETFPFWLFGALNAVIGQVDLAVENRINRIISESDKEAR